MFFQYASLVTLVTSQIAVKLALLLMISCVCVTPSLSVYTILIRLYVATDLLRLADPLVYEPSNIKSHVNIPSTFVNNFFTSNMSPPFYTITADAQPSELIAAYKSPSVVPLAAVVSSAKQTFPLQSTVRALERASLAVPLPTMTAYCP